MPFAHFIISSSGTGNTVIKAVAVLKEHNVAEENIILSNLFCTPFAAKSVMAAYPQVCGHCFI
jgi:uracil phosphoribosyltransferase